ncbi:polysaccharide deacetylase family protein [Spirulina subsalsa]|nr:polysaccharide deacetylase family protein [Spirulina subsalsa]
MSIAIYVTFLRREEADLSKQQVATRKRSKRKKNVISARIKLAFVLGVLITVLGAILPVGFAAHQQLMSQTLVSPILLGTGLEQLNTVASQALHQQSVEISKALNGLIPQQFQGKTVSQVPLNTGRKVIALTFDDGPWPEFTNEILYILKHHHVKATFFVIGRNVRNFPERTKQMYLHGHALGNHTWSHPYHQHSEGQAAGQIDNTTQWIEQATGGVKSRLFRPPGGFLNNGLAAYAAKQGQTVVMWSVDSKDYYAPAPRIIENVLSQAKPGAIVLLHDGGGDRRPTIVALPTIITKLREQGYEFVTVPELLDLKAQETQTASGG